jgi:sulfite reductase (NADPH) hemoprotein beta-component
MGAVKPSAVERIKAASRGLRGTIVESLADPVTAGLAEDDQQLLKFHGSYQQYDRDSAEARRQSKLEPSISFMIRTRLPGGMCSPAQWLALDALATRYGNGTLRLTSRQAFQLHGVLKGDLKPAIAAMNAALVDTIAACGDVNRNVLASPGQAASPAHGEVLRWAARLSAHLLPHSRAYHEIWLDGARVAPEQEREKILGANYLPRKFKAAIAIPPVNDVDVFAHDLGFIAIVEGGRLAGFDLAVGGGLGATHGDAGTYPRLADVVGFLTPDHLIAVAEAVVTTQRDFGDRGERKHARLKYTIADRGIEWFRAELERRLGFALEPPRPFEFTTTGDRFGWNEDSDGRWNLTLRIESGRVADRGECRLRADRRGPPRAFPADTEPESHRRRGAGRRPVADRRTGRGLRARRLPQVQAHRARVAGLRCAANLPAGHGRGGALPARGAHGDRRVDGKAWPCRRAAAVSREWLPEWLLTALPRRGRSGRQGTGPLQPASRRGTRWSPPGDVVPRESG